MMAGMKVPAMMVGFSTFFRVVLITLVECDSLTADAKAKLRTLLDESDLGELSEMQPPELLARVHDIVGEALLRRTLAALVRRHELAGKIGNRNQANYDIAHQLSLLFDICNNPACKNQVQYR